MSAHAHTGVVLTYEQTLEALHGLIGKRVIVSIGDLDGVVVASLAGIFRRAAELPRELRDRDEEVLVFDVGIQAPTVEEGAGFVVSSSAFRGAGWTESGILAAEFGRCLVTLRSAPVDPAQTVGFAGEMSES